MRKQARKLATILLLLIIPVLVPGIITLAYAEPPDILIRQYEDNEVDTSGDFAVALKDEPVPLSSVAAPRGWSFLNLLFTFAGIVVALFISFYIFAKKRRALANDNVKSGRVTPLQFLLAPFFAIAGMALFALTQDLSTTMITADGLTIAHVTIFICTLLSSIMVYRSEKYGNDELQQDV